MSLTIIFIYKGHLLIRFDRFYSFTVLISFMVLTLEGHADEFTCTFRGAPVRPSFTFPRGGVQPETSSFLNPIECDQLELVGVTTSDADQTTNLSHRLIYVTDAPISFLQISVQDASSGRKEGIRIPINGANHPIMMSDIGRTFQGSDILHPQRLIRSPHMRWLQEEILREVQILQRRSPGRRLLARLDSVGTLGGFRMYSDDRGQARSHEIGFLQSQPRPSVGGVYVRSFTESVDYECFYSTLNSSGVWAEVRDGSFRPAYRIEHQAINQGDQIREVVFCRGRVSCYDRHSPPRLIFGPRDIETQTEASSFHGCPTASDWYSNYLWQQGRRQRSAGTPGIQGNSQRASGTVPTDAGAR